MNNLLPRIFGSRPTRLGAIGLALLFLVAGCEAPGTALPASAANKQAEPQTISEGDVLKIEFPGGANLNTTQQVRRDGRISLGIIGEVAVSGMTPADLEKELAKRYSTQLVSSEVNVTVVSSSFSVFVTGAVVRPGKIQPDHPITALEAVMEAGGFDLTKADMEAVVVVRQEKGGTRNYTVNLKEVLEGKSNVSFYLKPSDIVYVKEKFSWF
jgi:polysaccharide export outer membrane protein